MRSRNVSSQMVPRRGLEARLDEALGHRLALVVADAGFGKTTLLASWAAGINAVIHDVTPTDDDLSRFVRHVVDALRLRVPALPGELAVTGGHQPEGTDHQARPEAAAEVLGGALEQHVVRDVALVLDNVHLLSDGPSLRFLASLVRHAPPLLHIVLAGRAAPAIPVDRLRARGDVVALHGAELAFTVDEVADLLTVVAGPDAAVLAPSVHAATAGWPAAVRLAAESLREVPTARRPAHVARLGSGHGEISRLAGEIYQQEPESVKRLLVTTALFDEVSVELLEALGIEAREPIAALDRRGLFLEPGSWGPGWYRLHAIATDPVARHGPALDGQLTRLRLAAATWFMTNGLPHAALRQLLVSERYDDVVALLTGSSSYLLGNGHADEVLHAVARLPEAVRDRSVERLAGEAYQLRGEWQRALECYERAAPDAGPLEPGLAWRMGLIHYLRGDLTAALAMYRRAETGEAEPGCRDTALLLSWTASCHWMRGDPDACRPLAVRALRIATRTDDAQALAAAHTVLAMLAAYEGDRRANGAHYLKALRYAERAQDVLQMVRIRCNRGSHYLEEGAYPEALAELDVAIRLADLSGFTAFGALALTNRGEARLGLGRLEEARHDFEAAVAAFEDLGSALVANPLHRLGALRALRGEAGAARRAFETAIRYAERAGDAQALAPALAGLARLLADEEPELAADLADRAVASGAGISAVTALLAAGTVALSRGDHGAVRRHADAAAEVAEARRDRAGLAEAVALRAAATEDPREALALADQAVALWRATADPVGLAQAELVRAERLDPASARAVVEAVRTRMRALGCRKLDTRAEVALNRRWPGTEPSVRIETLGGFRLLRSGVVVPSSAWKSRKARDLVKILLSRRGRPICQERLAEILWPGAPPAAVANRLYVLVSTVRSLFDPERVLGTSGFLATDAETIRLVMDRLDVDVERFLGDATAGVRMLREDRPAEGMERLVAAEAGYAGDFLEEDPYAEWAAALREEARATYREVAARLARHARDRGDPDSAVRYLLRILERDPYDEQSHLDLVSVLSGSGRHGAARRHYRSYCARMAELGVEATPFPQAL
ncbi:MAG TPA: BTAD domain-containing putative transcriptional regulator [Micromonosporaceae bacterium]